MGVSEYWVDEPDEYVQVLAALQRLSSYIVNLRLIFHTWSSHLQLVPKKLLDHSWSNPLPFKRIPRDITGRTPTTPTSSLEPVPHPAPPSCSLAICWSNRLVRATCASLPVRNTRQGAPETSETVEPASGINGAKCQIHQPQPNLDHGLLSSVIIDIFFT